MARLPVAGLDPATHADADRGDPGHVDRRTKSGHGDLD